MAVSKIILSLSNPVETIPSNIKPRLKKIHNIRAVIFDVYGVLLVSNSETNCLSGTIGNDVVIRESLENCGFDILEPNTKFGEHYNEHINVHYGIRQSEGIAYPEINICDVWQDFLIELFTQGIIDGDLTERSIRKVILNYEFRVNPVWPRKGALEFLRMLQDNDIYSGAISSAQFYTPLSLETLYQNSLDTLGFKKQICIWSYEHRHVKPSPVLFELCLNGLRDLDISPKETLYIGYDVRKDIIPANKFGFKTALFVGDGLLSYSPIEEMASCKPTITFTEFDQLADYIL